MKNVNLANLALFSLLVMPAVSHADLLSKKIDLNGSLKIQGSLASIVLEEKSGDSIRLKKGDMEIEVVKIAKLISLSTPTLLIKQHGQTFSVNVPRESYHNLDAFTLKSEDSNLNYDLYLRRTEIKESKFETSEIRECALKQHQYICATDFDGKFDCDWHEGYASGTQNGIATYLSSMITYKLTFAQKNIQIAEFTSIDSVTKPIHFTPAEECK